MSEVCFARGLDGAAEVGPDRKAVAVCGRAHVSFDPSVDVEELTGRYLAPTERSTFDSMAGRGRIPWLLGRMAAKEAVRGHLVSRQFTEIDRTRIVVDNDARGGPVVQVRGARLATRGVRVSIAHKPTVAVAMAATLRGSPRSATGAGQPIEGIGIDVEAVEPRPPTFERTILTSSERSLHATSDDERDTWLTRLWTAKEAVSKSIGSGLGGRPKDFEVDAVHGERLRCCGRWIATEPLEIDSGNYIVAWTEID